MEFRVGSTGAGVFAGCGAGFGVIAPLSLHGIPVLGQLAGSLGASLASVDAALGGLGAGARARAQELGARSGVRGLTCGFGCGVMVGYGWGAGLYLKPAALQSLQAAAAQLRERALCALPPELQPRAAQQAAPPGEAGGGALRPVSGLSAGSSYVAEPGPAAADVTDLMRLVVKQQNLLEDLQQQVATLQRAVCKIDSSAPGCTSKQ